MSILPDHEIAELGAQKRISPYDAAQVQPSSYDVRLAPTLLVPHLRDHAPVDLRYAVVDRTDPVDIYDGFLLPRGRFVLGSTVERIHVPIDCVCRVEGKSSLARIGIQIHSAGFIDPGYCGNVTLEITNFSDDPVVLWPDVLIGQLSWERLSSAARRPYSGRYQGSEGTVGSRWKQAHLGEETPSSGHPMFGSTGGQLTDRRTVDGGTLLKFRYLNWRGAEHEYVIEPEIGPRAIGFGQPERRWYLNGFLVTRDGDARPDMGPTRRRSFEIARMSRVTEVERSA